ncbi:hypothetical protein BDV96DRAFT_507694 [Lophiotrema nucula]|uniref:Uncharacterized protein n=1 Tax=Lophiotrema nucula TaxID=690887 RepID=A0A6A5YIJ9_9PLEO|nr:hypothetical protein BDV96DRAFT_507694 [Lophiotrema nucula]
MPEYPGLGLDLRYNPQRDYGHYPIGAHGSNYGADSAILPVRELAMMSIMDSLTDKEDWQRKVFDDGIVSKWRKEALAIPDEELWKLAISDKRQYWNEEGELSLHDEQEGCRLEGIMNETTFDCCIDELRSKAKYYENSDIIPTLDACASVAKSDRLIPSDLQEALRNAFDTLKTHQSSAPDWHPNTNEQVQDLVHPSMYPLVYGRSRVLKEEVVGLDDAIEKWAGKGEIIPKDDWEYNPDRDRFTYGVGSGTVPPEYWSKVFQWLPANVAIQVDGTVKLTSYINNLHPNKYPDVYSTIEKLIQTALPAWDQCLGVASGYHKKDGAGRTTSRFPYPDNPDDENEENWDPPNAEDVADVTVNWEEVDSDFNPEYDDETEKKWEFLRKPVNLEASFEEINYAPAPGTRLIERFRDTGLQVIVKMASIELTPDRPEFPVGGWHIEGQMNEHICGTVLYYLDSENITDSNLSFRMQTSAYLMDDIEVGQDAYHWLEQVYGTELGGRSAPCLQNYGSVETRPGRLLAFPNVFQHRVSSFRLKDPSKPGHRRFIALWLVDPNIRVISTANVPPQQMDWWLDAVLGSTPQSRDAAAAALPPELVALMREKGVDSDASALNADTGSLPPELMEMVREHFHADAGALPMGLEEAKQHRLELMKERGAFVRKTEEGWQQHSYGFCEH